MIDRLTAAAYIAEADDVQRWFSIVSAGREPITENGRCVVVLPQLSPGDFPRMQHNRSTSE